MQFLHESTSLVNLESLIKRLDNHKQRGLQHFVKYCKATRSNFYNYLSGNPLRDDYSKCTKGFPWILNKFRTQVDNREYRVIAILITILQISRVVKVFSEPDLSSITQPPSGRDVTYLDKYVEPF